MRLIRRFGDAKSYLFFRGADFVRTSADKNLTLDAVSIKLANGANHGPPNSDGGPGTRYPELFGADATVLVSAKEPFDLIVVDHVEKTPTGN